MSFGVDEKIDKRFMLDLFITTDIATKYQRELPYKKCDAGCKKGMVENGYCEKCTKPYLLKEILEIPDRYKVKFKSDAFMSKVDKLMEHKFLVLKGSDFYIKLVAFYMAQKIIEKNKMVYHVETKKFKNFNEISELTEETHTDFLALRFADVVLFDDVCQNVSDINYKVFLQKRMDNNLPIIFFNYPEVVSLKDTSGNLLADITEFTVDDIGIKIGVDE